MPKTIGDTATLNNGVQMPYFGLGVFQTGRGQQAEKAIRHALDIGYRHIDTASIYGNERAVGQVVRHSGLPREDIFVTTKLWNDQHGYESALQAYQESLGRLGLDHADLYLIHYPVSQLRGESWRALEALYIDGRVRAIGVSNYTIRHLEELLAESSVLPAVNQVEFHPFLYQRDLLDYCHQRGIRLEAYSPLTQGRRLNHPTLNEIGAHYAKTAAQILIRWALQHDTVVIPKSANKQRIEENAAVFDFEISASHMAQLNDLHEDLRVSWDPTDTP